MVVTRMMMTVSTSDVRLFLLLLLVVSMVFSVFAADDGNDVAYDGTLFKLPKEPTSIPMTLAFYQKMLHHHLEHLLEDHPTQPDWQLHNDYYWNAAVWYEQEMGLAYPFLICAQERDDYQTTMVAEMNMAMAAVGETDFANMYRHFYPVYNSPEMSCWVGRINGTIAAYQMDLFKVQPLSFFMKMNAARDDFFTASTSEEDREVEYDVRFCPGTFTPTVEWGLSQVKFVSYWIPEFAVFPQMAGKKKRLMELYDDMQANASYCDDLLIANTYAEFYAEDDDYDRRMLLGINVPYLEGDASVGARACFDLAALAVANDPHVCHMERRLKMDFFDEVADEQDDHSNHHHHSGSSVRRTMESRHPGIDQDQFQPFVKMNITGLGQVVAVSDSGLDLESCYFRDFDNITFGNDVFNTSRRKVVQYGRSDGADFHESVNGHGSHVAGIVAGRRSTNGTFESEKDGLVDGVATGAKLAMLDMAGSSGGLRPPYYIADLFRPGMTAGAFIHTASWGSNTKGEYTATDRDFDEFVHDNSENQMLIVVAAGNSGPRLSMASPAGAKNVLAVGNCYSGGHDAVIRRKSSRGPTMDDRIKPEIMATGVHVLSVGARLHPSCDPEDPSALPDPADSWAWTRPDERFGIHMRTGTSQSAPVVSGSAALVRQYLAEGWHGNGTKGSAETPMPTPTATLLKAILINGAQPLFGYTMNQVDSDQGFGKLSLINSLPAAGHNSWTANFLDKESIVASSENTYSFVIPDDDACNGADDNAEFSTTLVWMEPPGYYGCKRCLENDLDLTVVQTTADGKRTTHYPNGRFNRRDEVNNVERVRVRASVGDVFTVTVKGTIVAKLSQEYALATVYGCVTHRALLAQDKDNSAAPWKKLHLTMFPLLSLLSVFYFL